MKKFCTIALTMATVLCCAGLTTYTCRADEQQPTDNAVTDNAVVAPVVNPVVQTNYGKVEGFVQDGVTRFYGVPYAKPPIDELRLREPEEPDAWEGTRICNTCSAAAPQKPTVLSNGTLTKLDGIDGTELSTSEDCLYLNIFAPPNAKNAPVFVWIHGGAFTVGSGSNTTFDGSAFARDGIIVVSINYRLGALGFLSDPEIANGASLGILDQIQALKWVHENIAAFGGDPRSVTVGGESAGACCTSALIFSPQARGLFQQAIVESGNILGLSCVGGYLGTSLESVQSRTREIMRLAECETVADLLACPADKLLEVADYDAEILRSIHTKNNVGIVGDGKVLPANFQNALNNGQYNRVKLLYGINKDDASMFVNEPSVGQYTSFVNHVFGDKAQEIKDRFPVDETNVRERSLALVKDCFFLAGSKKMADKMVHDGLGVYAYEFTFTPQALEGTPYGAGHGLEIFFAFDTLPDALRADPQCLQVRDYIHKYWVNFIKNGTPNLKGMPTWMRYTPDGQNVMSLGEQPVLQPMSDNEDVNFLVERMNEQQSTASATEQQQTSAPSSEQQSPVSSTEQQQPSAPPVEQQSPASATEQQQPSAPSVEQIVSPDA